MTVEQLRQALSLVLVFLKPLASKTSTSADDKAVEFLEALIASPKLLEFILSLVNKDEDAVTIVEGIASGAWGHVEATAPSTEENDFVPLESPLFMAQLESGLEAVIETKLEGALTRRERRALNSVVQRRGLRRHAAQRVYERYLEEGGHEGKILSFLDWVIANWDSILKMIMSIVGLFGGI